jgi:hypothetical protein
MSYIRGFYRNVPGNKDYSGTSPVDEDVYLNKIDNPSLHTNSGLIHIGEGIAITRDGEIEVDVEYVRSVLGDIPAGSVDISAVAQALLNSGQLEPDLQELAGELLQTGQFTPDTAAVANTLIASGTLSPYVTTLIQQMLQAGGYEVDLEALKTAILADPNFANIIDSTAIESSAVTASLQAVAEVLANYEGGEGTFITDYGIF